MSGGTGVADRRQQQSNNKKASGDMESKDEVDFVRRNSKELVSPNHLPFQCPIVNKKRVSGTLYGDCEIKTNLKSSLSSLEKFSLFRSNSRKKSEGTTTSSSTSSPKEKPKFVKSASIARLLGNNYSPRKPENETTSVVTAKMTAADSVHSAACQCTNIGCNCVNSKTSVCCKKCSECTKQKVNNSTGKITRRFGTQDRFQKCSKLEDVLNEFSDKDFQNVEKDLSVKALRTISRGLGKLWWKRTHSVNISTPDPEFKVSYLGNVLTGWAKGDGCVEKPLNSLWRNYTQNHKPDIIMRIRVCASGLKATTRQHGLTEYWAHRITHCCAPKNYPRIFCWVYRHEGRKLKHEMRCHAVLCAKESIAQSICNTLRENLDRALRDFKREKLSKQNARLSLANAVYENPSLPRRKILLSVGGNNYRPPLERSKSAPKLMAIEEAIGEEGEEEETNEPDMPSCCVKGSMYPAMTLGRRRCRRGHSIRRTGKYPMKPSIPNFEVDIAETKESACSDDDIKSPENQMKLGECSKLLETHFDASEDNIKDDLVQGHCIGALCESVSSLVSEEDDEVDKLLSRNNYDINSPLTNELLSYFDMKLRPRTASLTNLEDISVVFEPTLTPDAQSMRRAALSLDNLDSYSDEGDADEYEGDDDEEEADGAFYHQTTILNLLHSESLIKSGSNGVSGPLFDSDEGSISSGCETASTVTANVDESSLRYIQSQNQEPQQQQASHAQRHHTPVAGTILDTQDEASSTSSARHSMVKSSSKTCNGQNHNRKPHRDASGGDGSDSEFSDESGYVEFQDNLVHRHKSLAV